MKTRLDVLLVERGLAESREKAKAIIMARRSIRRWTERRQGWNLISGESGH